MKPGTYKLVFDWIEPPAGVDKINAGFPSIRPP